MIFTGVGGSSSESTSSSLCRDSSTASLCMNFSRPSIKRRSNTLWCSCFLSLYPYLCTQKLVLGCILQLIHVEAEKLLQQFISGQCIAIKNSLSWFKHKLYMDKKLISMSSCKIRLTWLYSGTCDSPLSIHVGKETVHSAELQELEHS